MLKLYVERERERERERASVCVWGGGWGGSVGLSVCLPACLPACLSDVCLPACLSVCVLHWANPIDRHPWDVFAWAVSLTADRDPQIFRFVSYVRCKLASIRIVVL